VDRLLFIRGAQRLGLRLAEIRELLAVRDTGACPCEPAEGLLRRHVAEIETEMARLAALRDDLLGMLAACQGPAAPTRCQAPGARPAFRYRKGGDGDVRVLRHRHLRRLMLRRRMLLS
jgi:hypothetical protein